jgi:hypothetical protein
MDLDYNNYGLSPSLRVRVTSRPTRSNFKRAHSLQPSFTLHRPLPVLLQTFKICQYLPATAQLPFACRIDRCFVVPACPSQSADRVYWCFRRLSRDTLAILWAYSVTQARFG